MAKNIDFMGAIFPDVPSVKLPQQGGGLVAFDDTTDATATADKILSGYTAYANGQKLTGTASGGITPSGTIQITQNGQVDVTQYASANVNVSGGGGKNVQVVDAHSNTNSTTAIPAGDPIIVAKSGIYDISWYTQRTGTGAAAVFLYVNDEAASGGYTPDVYNNRGRFTKIENVSLNQGDKVQVWTQVGGTSTHVIVSSLAIVEQ